MQAAQKDATEKLYTEQARVDNLVDRAEAEGVRVLEEPKGRPLFQFFLAQGKTRPVMTFFDSGCSDAIFRDTIPVSQ